MCLLNGISPKSFSRRWMNENRKRPSDIGSTSNKSMEQYRSDEDVLMYKELRGLGQTEERSFDRSGEADELRKGVIAEVRDPEVAARVDCDGVGLKQACIGREARDRREHLTGRSRRRTGKLGDGWAAIIRHPDIARAIDGNALRVRNASANISVGDDRSGAGDLADAVTEEICHPEVPRLVEGEPGGPVAAGNVGELLAVGRDLGDGVLPWLAIQPLWLPSMATATGKTKLVVV